LAHSGKKGKGTAAAGPTGSREPRRYVEGESEQEAEAMDVELEEGSDVGSIEDIELGAESGSEADADADADADMDEEEDEEEEYEEGLDGDDDGEDSEDDSEGDEGPWLNGFIDDEAEEAEEESESE
jgi:U3 small nucleolar RNA-associated protein 5